MSTLEQDLMTIGKPLSTFAAVFDVEKLEIAQFEDVLIANDTTVYIKAFNIVRGIPCQSIYRYVSFS